jgi:hypothetical protein
MMTVPATRPPNTPAPLRMTPGRWGALAIGVPFALALIGWSAFSLVAGLGRASYAVSTSIPLRTSLPLQHGQLAASVASGDITLHQEVTGSTARLTGTVHYSLVRPGLTVSKTASGTSIDVRCRIPTGNCGLSGTIDVPPDTSVNLATGGGNMQVNGIQRDVILNSDGGNVTVSGVGGTADLSTGGGNVTASDLGNTLRFSTDGGDVNGNGLTSPRVTMESGGGNVTLVFTRAPANLSLTSDGGDITIVFPHDGTSYAIPRPITDGGDYSATVPTKPSSGHTITVNSGGGNVSIAEAG